MLNKFKGCLIGLACGDYLGMPVEFMGKDKVKAYFGNSGLKPTISYYRGGEEKPAGYYTDDTALAICIAESLLEADFNIKDQFKRFQKWFYEGYATPHGNKAFGIGQNTLRTLISGDPNNLDTELKHNPKKGGNGALMRCAPLGLAYYNNEQSLIEKTLRSTIITHNNEMAVWTCLAHNSFISYSLHDYKKELFTTRFLQNYPACPLELKNALSMDFYNLDEKLLHTTGYTLNTLVISMYAFLTTNNYKDCISKAILIGGDTDTQGAVSGSLAGAYYGLDSIPPEWQKTLLRKDYIQNLATKLGEKYL